MSLPFINQFNLRRSEKNKSNGCLFKGDMERDLQFTVKLKSVLSRLLLSDFKITDDTIFQKLFDLIYKNYPSFEYSGDNPFHELFIPWLISVNKVWSDIHIASKLFVLRITGLMCRDERGFSRLLESNILSELLVHMDYKKEDQSFSLTLSYVGMLHDFISHTSGVNWVIDKGLWREILTTAHSSNSLYALRSSREFTADLIIFLAKENVALCHTIFNETVIFSSSIENKFIKPGEILEPLVVNSAPNSNDVPSKKMQNVSVNEIVLIKEILHQMLRKKLSPERTKDILEKYKLHEWCWSYIHDGEEEKILSNVSKLLCALHICCMDRELNGTITASSVRRFFGNFISHMTLLIRKCKFDLIREACIEYFALWSIIDAKLVYDKEEYVYIMENYFFLLLTMPLFLFIRVNRVIECEVMDAYVARLFQAGCSTSIRTCYLYRDRLDNCPQLHLELLAIEATHALSSIPSHLQKEQGVMAFQTFVYVLKEFATDGPGEEGSEVTMFCDSLVAKCPRLLSAILNALHRYLLQFGLSWRDSLETVCVLPILQKILDNPELTSKLCTEVVRVVKVTLLNSFPPNLALLTDTLQGSSLTELGRHLTRLLHSPHWEVRDSALELLEVISSMAGQKWPALQELLLSNNLPEIVVAMLQSDSESYVRASALCSLQQMVSIDRICETVLLPQQLLNKVLSVLHNDPEGIVRHQAILLLKEIYCRQCISEADMERSYNVLCLLTTSDLHWEVRQGCLQLWDTVLETFLTREGMVDGCFPDHLFSREKRKIIKLTPAERSSSVIRVFQMFSQAGGLHVLWKTLEEDCDLEVVKEAVRLLDKLTLLAKKYDIVRELENGKLGRATDEQEEVGSAEDTEEDVLLEEVALETDKQDKDSSPLTNKMWKERLDEVIEGIVEEEDLRLLAGLALPPQLGASTPVLHCPPSRPRPVLPALHFLRLVSSEDHRARLAHHELWVRSSCRGLTSLLDDILLSNQISNVGFNAADCY